MADNDTIEQEPLVGGFHEENEYDIDPLPPPYSPYPDWEQVYVAPINRGSGGEKYVYQQKATSEIVRSFFVMLCCCPALGTIALIYAVLASTNTHPEGARIQRSYSRNLSFAGFLVGIIMLAISFAFLLWIS